MIDKSQSRQLLQAHFPHFSDDQVEKLIAFEAAIRDWNEKINLVSRKDADQLMMRHILHSLAIAKAAAFPDGFRLLDVGTGGGFPGIPLAIAFPKCHFLLADSIQKKIRVVNDIIHSLELDNAEAQVIRVETLDRKFDAITARAVAQTDRLVGWTRKLLDRRRRKEAAYGYWLLKGGDLSEELNAANVTKVVRWELATWYRDPFYATKKLLHLRPG